MARAKSYREIAEELIADFIPLIRDAFVAAIGNVVNDVILKNLIDAITEGDLDKALRVVNVTDAAMRPLTATLETAFENGGVAVGKTFPRVLNTPAGQTVFRFDVRNSRAEKFLRENSSSLVTAIREDARTNIRNVMFRGVQDGTNPRTVALDITGRINPISGRREGGVIGLTQNQERWVANTRRNLNELDDAYFSRELRDKRFDSTVRKAIETGKPLPADTVDKLVSRYKDNTLKYRGDTIARTEAIHALNQSEYEALSQAADIGAVKTKDIKRVWDSAGNDGRTRDSHLKMEGQTVRLNEPFTFPGGSKAMYPGDTSMGAPAEETVQCRCRVRTKIDWLADID